MNVLSKVWTVQEAAKAWGLNADYVKRLCQHGKVEAKKIGKAWAIDATQPNPKKGE